MKMQHTTLTAALTAALGLVAIGDANAYVYGRSYLELSEVSIVITDNLGVGTPVPGGATIDNFQFTTTNTASLNGNAVIDDASCGGVPGAPGGGTNNCNPQPNTGLPTPNTRLDAAAQNAPGGSVVRANNSFNFFGPATDQYSNSDSVIYTAQLTGDVVSGTHTEQIAEAELQTSGVASANAEIQSITGFTFAFTVTGANAILVDFVGALDILAAINDPTLVTGGSQANVRVQLTLSNDDDGNLLQWTPNGNTATGCVATFGTCLEIADDFDLNGDVGVTTDGTSSGRSNNGNPALQDFTMLFTGLYDGDWSLTLDTLTSTQLSRVPEPGILGLLGIGLAGMGLAFRRRTQA